MIAVASLEPQENAFEWSAEILDSASNSSQLRFGQRASRIGRVVLLSVLLAVILVSLSSFGSSGVFDDGSLNHDVTLEADRWVESDPLLAKRLLKVKAGIKAASKRRIIANVQQQVHGESIVPASESSSLWDFPEVKRYQVQTNRENYWKNVDYMKVHHVSELGWPDGSASGLRWPTEDGQAYTDKAPHMVEAGSLLERGDIMPVTRPFVEWAPGCSPAICPMDTPRKERAYAWKYCMNHFVTNAEKRYCFSILLSPPRPPPSCPRYDPPPDHGRVVTPDFSDQGLAPGRVPVGSSVEVVCDEGYSVAGNATAVCLAAGGGYTAAGKCVPVTCPAYAPPAHGSVAPAGRAEASVGDTVGIRCDEGYRLVGPGRAECGMDGEFSECVDNLNFDDWESWRCGEKQGGHCEPLMCDPLPPPAHGFVTPAGAVSVGSHVAIVCDEGYAVAGAAAAECVPPGVFGPAGRCEPVVCGPYPAVAHGAADQPAGEAAQYMDTVGIRCDEGYRLVGPERAQCEADGKFSQGGHCEPVMCDPLPPPAHGFIRPAGAVANGESVNVTCETGYEAEGDTHPMCGPDGAFLSDPAECVEAFCDPYQAPPHGSVSPGGPIRVGDRVEVTCDPDYIAVPRPAPGAEPPPPPPPRPATSSSAAGGEAAAAAGGGGSGGAGEGRVAAVECGPGKVYEAEVECEATCPPYPPPPHGTVRPGGRVAVGGVVEVACDAGYTLGEGFQAEAKCMESGAYDQPSAECNPLPECPPYPVPAHGAVSPGGGLPVPIGGSVTVTCDPGYQLTANSSSEAVCETSREFDHPKAECEPVPECGPYAPPEHGAAAPDGRVLHVGDQVTITCDKGYHLSPKSSPIATCTGTDYDYPTAQCLPNPQCPPLKPPNHASVSPAGNVSEGQCVEVKCDGGWYSDPQGDGTDHPCCNFNIVDGVLEFDAVRECISDDPLCEICSDIKVCPHCFIGKKLFPAKRREFHFD